MTSFACGFPNYNRTNQLEKLRLNKLDLGRISYLPPINVSPPK